MKRTHILLMAIFVCLCIIYACKDENTTSSIEEKNGWYSLTKDFSAYRLFSVFFVDQNIGYIVGENGLIIKTTNGGLNWVTQTSNTTELLSSVHFVDANNGCAVGDNGTIVKTSDGGKNWVNQISDVSYLLTTVIFTNINTGIIVGYSGTILRTIDGGENWVIHPSGTTNELLSLCFVNENIGYAVGNNGSILKTTNGGTSWDLKQVRTDKMLNSVSFPDPEVGYIVGNKKDMQSDDVILKTTNGGNDWTQIKSGDYFRKVHFVNANLGHMISSYTPTVKALISKTTDGGVTWTGKRCSVKALSSIYFIDENIGFAVGYDTDSKINILKTKNGGED